jgi:hypothetical protein
VTWRLRPQRPVIACARGASGAATRINLRRCRAIIRYVNPWKPERWKCPRCGDGGDPRFHDCVPREHRDDLHDAARPLDGLGAANANTSHGASD